MVRLLRSGNSNSYKKYLLKIIKKEDLASKRGLFSEYSSKNTICTSNFVSSDYMDDI